jgi:phosphoribosylanthranilate isomerase
MSLRYPVKINRVNNLSEARYCAGMGVDMIGISNEISTEEYVAITNWITGVEICFDIYTLTSNIIEVVNQLSPSFVETDNTQLINELKNQGNLKTIYRIESGTFAEISDKCEELNSIVSLFSISRVQLSNDELKSLSEKYDIIINIDGYSGEESEALYNEISPKYIALNGGSEIAPGLKNFDEMAEILEFLETNED